MFTLDIGGKVAGFKFGIGFVREISAKMTKPMDGVPGQKQEIGLNYYVGAMYDEDPLALIEVLATANKTESDKVTRKEIEAFIEDEETDIAEVFEKVRFFLKSANATKKAALEMDEVYAIEKMKQEAAKAKAKAEAAAV